MTILEKCHGDRHNWGGDGAATMPLWPLPQQRRRPLNLGLLKDVAEICGLVVAACAACLLPLLGTTWVIVKAVLWILRSEGVL